MELELKFSVAHELLKRFNNANIQPSLDNDEDYKQWFSFVMNQFVPLLFSVSILKDTVEIIAPARVVKELSLHLKEGEKCC